MLVFTIAIAMTPVAPVMIVVTSATVSMVFITTMFVLSVFPVMVLTIIGNVIIPIPAFFYKIYRPATGMIAVAVLAPPFCMARGHPQVDRLILFHDMPVDDDRFAIDDAWCRIRELANIDAAIEPGLADADGYAHICSQCRT